MKELTTETARDLISTSTYTFFEWPQHVGDRDVVRKLAIATTLGQVKIAWVNNYGDFKYIKDSIDIGDTFMVGQWNSSVTKQGDEILMDKEPSYKVRCDYLTFKKRDKYLCFATPLGTHYYENKVLELISRYISEKTMWEAGFQSVLHVIGELLLTTHVTVGEYTITFTSKIK